MRIYIYLNYRYETSVPAHRRRRSGPILQQLSILFLAWIGCAALLYFGTLQEQAVADETHVARDNGTVRGLPSLPLQRAITENTGTFTLNTFWHMHKGHRQSGK